MLEILYGMENTMAGHSKELLHHEILIRSESKVWEVARLEWYLDYIYQEPGDTCICGEHPITDHCVIANTKTLIETIVGNICVNNFLGLASTRLFRSMKIIQNDIDRSASEALIEHAFDRGWLNQWERDFSLDTRLKRSLYPKQLVKRRQINEKLLMVFRQKGMVER